MPVGCEQRTKVGLGNMRASAGETVKREGKANNTYVRTNKGKQSSTRCTESTGKSHVGMSNDRARLMRRSAKQANMTHRLLV